MKENNIFKPDCEYFRLLHGEKISPEKLEAETPFVVKGIKPLVVEELSFDETGRINTLWFIPDRRTQNDRT